MSTRVCVFLAIWFCPYCLVGQSKIPPFDVELKTGFASSKFNSGVLLDPASSVDYRYDGGLNIFYAGLNYPVSRKFWIGIFYEKSFNSKADHYRSGQGQSVLYDAGHQSGGLSFRLIGGKRPLFRPYVQLSILATGMYMNLDKVRVTNSTSALGLNTGVLLKLRHNIYLNLVDVGVTAWNNSFFFVEGTTLMLNLKTGILIDFTRRK